MRKRQCEIFAEGVEHRKYHAVMLILAINRVELEVTESVVHPAHIPLEAEAQAAKIGGAGNRGPGGGLLGDGQHTGMASVDDLVQPLQEGDGREVLSTAIFVRDPLAKLA